MTVVATMQVSQATELAAHVVASVEGIIVGKRSVLEQVLIGIMCQGHVLLEDLPGVGKTVMARGFASALGLDFVRLQFTPDLLPSDVTGAPTLDPVHRVLEFRPGPVFTQVLLADEINRTPPKTQAALLEAMSERSVSSDGTTYPLPSPFLVLATANPIEFEGTYPLPEAQLDRFAMRIRIGYPNAGDEAAMVMRRLDQHDTQAPTAEQVCDAETTLALLETVKHIVVEADLVDYAVRLVQAIRLHRDVAVGVSPRGTLMLMSCARARALVEGRNFVVPHDVKALAVPCLAHRVVLRPELWLQDNRADRIIDEVLGRVPTPSTRRPPS
jgi:MoxR-like ATPase